MFNPISIDEAVKTHIKLNGGDPRRVRAEFERHLATKKGGQMCQCGQTLVWAFGGQDLCFSCTTGEWDNSDDFEFEEVAAL